MSNRLYRGGTLLLVVIATFCLGVCLEPVDEFTYRAV